MISGDDDGGEVMGGGWVGVSSQREETFNLGEITKAGQKTALDGRMPPGRLCRYYVGESGWSCSEGQLERWRMEDGEGGRGPAAVNPT